MYIEVKELNKNFGSFQASRDVSFSVEKGKMAALLGPSGSGKTTTLRMIAGLETPDSGEILIDGRRMNDALPAERGIGFVFQNYALFRYMTVYDNIAFGLEVARKDTQKIKDRVDELLELTELKGLETRYPDELSGGQKQRVAFARALAPEPRLLLLDEPFAAIDARVRKELRQWLRDMIHRFGLTSIFVTHDQDEAVEVADQIIVMNCGSIEQTGTPYEIYKEPKTRFVSSFVGENTVIEDFGRLKGFGIDEMDDVASRYEGAIIRPEFVEAFKSDNPRFRDMVDISETGIITDVVFRGNNYEVQLDVNGLELKTYRSLERRSINKDEKMNVIIYRLFAYDREGGVHLIENSNLKRMVKKEGPFEAYLYSNSGYFVV